MSLKKNVIASYLGQGWAAVMGVLFVPLYAKVLGPETFGLIGVFTILQAWMTLLDMGLTPTLNREMARMNGGARTVDSIRDLLRSLECVYLVLAIVMIAAAWWLAGPLAGGWLKVERLPLPSVVEAIRIMGFVLAARWLEQVYRGALQGLQDQVWLNAMQAVTATLRWGGAYLVIVLGVPSILVFFAWQGAVSVLTCTLLIYRTYRVLPAGKRRGRFDVRVLLDIRHFAGGMFFGALLSFALTQSDKLVVSKLLPLEQLGYYMIASTAASGLLQLVIPMSTAVYPRLTEHVSRNDTAGLADVYLNSCAWMAAIVAPPALLLTFFAHPVLVLWTGDLKMAAAVAPILSMLALGTLGNALMNLPYMLQLAHGWTSLSIKANVVAVLINVPLILLAVPYFGAVGGAYVWVALNAAYILIVAPLVYRRVLPQCKAPWYRDAVGRPMLAGVVTSTVLLLVAPHAQTRLQAGVLLACIFAALVVAIAGALPSVRQSLRLRLRRAG